MRNNMFETLADAFDTNLSFANISIGFFFCSQYSGIRIGPVVKKDVMKASIMLEHDSQ